MSRYKGLPNNTRACSWTVDPDWVWFDRCNACGSRRIFAKRYDVYLEAMDGSRKGHTFICVCGDCLLRIITEEAERILQAAHIRLHHEIERLTMNSTMAPVEGTSEERLG